MKMSRQSLLFEDCVHQDETTITTAKRAQKAQNLYCMCCLDTNVMFINLTTCKHSEYLDNFSKPEIKPDSQVVCLRCHVILKNIQLFKQQVQNSFKMFSNKASNTNINQKHKLEIHKAVNIGIPEIFKKDQLQIIKSETLKSSNKKHNNLQTALDIINSNNSMTFLAASALNAETLLNFSNTLFNIDILNSYKEISNDEVPSKKIKLESENLILPKSNLIQSNSDKTQSEINVVKKELNVIEPCPNEFQPQSIIIKDIQSQLQLDQDNLQRVPNELQPDPNKLQSVPNKLQSDPNKLQIDPNELQPQSNQSFNRNLTVPKSYRKKIKVVRMNEKELEQERALLSQTNEYLKCEFKCVSCIVGFQFQDNYNDHMKRKHGVDSGSILCKICSQRVATDSDLKLHLLRHYKRYQCVNCGKRFQIYDEGIHHYLKTHIGKKFRNKKIIGKDYK